MDKDFSTFDILNQPGFSTWLMVKMALRLLLAATAARAARVIIPSAKGNVAEAPFRVECGAYALQFTMRHSAPSRSLSKPRATTRKGVQPSTSTGTTPEQISLLPPDASLSTDPRGRSFEPWALDASK